MAYTAYPKGSEWRKWDLHVHTPKSVVQQFGGDSKAAWDAFIQKIASLPREVTVLGITDYLFCDGYEYLLTRRSEIPNIALIIPNIEFRLSTFSGTANNAKRHNFHVLFDPKIPVEVIREQFLNCLSTGYLIQDGAVWNQTPTIRSLAELGKQIKAAAPENNTIQTKSDFEAGFDNITYKREDIQKLLEKNCFKGRVLTAIGYSEWDQSRWDQSAAEKRTLINISDFALTSLDAPAKIEENRKDLVANKLNSLVLHSSDAHELDRVGKTMLWIKADPTFDGLKQILYEPEQRVYIGSTAPDAKDAAKVIKSISIERAGNWLADQTIELNRDLVAVIGGKGSGKTALADFIGYAGGDFDPDNENAFLYKASEPLTGTKIKIEWEIGAPDGPFTIHQDWPAEKKVRYLSQSFVESLCAHDQHEKLVKQIEDILFQYVPNPQKLGASDFESLKDAKTKAVQLEITKIRETIQAHNESIFALEEEIAKKPAQQEDLRRLTKEKEVLETQKPQITNAEDQRDQLALQTLREKKARLEKHIEGRRIIISELNAFRTRARLLKADIERFNSDVRARLDSWGLKDKTDSLVISTPADLDFVVSARITELGNEIKGVEGSAEDIIETGEETVFALNKEIAVIEARSRLEAQQKAKLAELGRRIAELTTQIDRLTKILADLESDKPNQLAEKKAQREAEYLKFFQKLDEKKRLLEELYKPLNESSGSPAERGKVEFYARFKFNIRRFIQEGMAMFDGRRMLVRDDKVLEDIAQQCWGALMAAIPNIQAAPFTVLERAIEQQDESRRVVADQLSSKRTKQNYYDWIYDVSYFDVEYGIKYEKVDLDKLSPGRKGVVLLMIYLGIDRDYRPLIIDQPEENLDNRSVYSTLVEYFRTAKKHRQIILVTHNANLVVNADAEQVIVANFDLERTQQANVIEYASGSLEFTKKLDGDDASALTRQGIREHVCEILEGGDVAFRRREHKYGFSS